MHRLLHPKNAFAKELGTAGALVAVGLCGCVSNTAPRGANAAVDGPVSDAGIACQITTGSRLPATPNGAPCIAPGRSYSSNDIAATGATTAAQALRLLDPSVTINH